MCNGDGRGGDWGTGEGGGEEEGREKVEKAAPSLVLHLYCFRGDKSETSALTALHPHPPPGPVFSPSACHSFPRQACYNSWWSGRANELAITMDLHKQYDTVITAGETVWRSGKALGWSAEVIRFESASALLSLPKKVVVCGRCLVTLSLTINETLKRLSSLPILMQESFW